MSREEEDFFFSLHTLGDISGKMINQWNQKTQWERAAFNQKAVQVRQSSWKWSHRYVCTSGCTVYTRHTQILCQHQKNSLRMGDRNWTALLSPPLIILLKSSSGAQEKGWIRVILGLKKAGLLLSAWSTWNYKLRLCLYLIEISL